MKNGTAEKIISLNDLLVRVEKLRAEGRILVQSHGVFDLIHPGHITHLKKAREQGNVLLVTVIRDEDVRRGPGRPIFPDQLRAENVASLECVDWVCVVNDDPPFDCVQAIQPNVFAKGQAYLERDRQVHEEIFRVEREMYFGKSKIYETGGFSFSSSSLAKGMLDLYPDDTRNYLGAFRSRYSFENIMECLNALRKLKVLLIGDGIIDEYHYCASMGKSAKAHLVVSRYLDHEVFNGGVFAIANHMAGLCDEVRLFSLLGKEESREPFIRANLKPNVAADFFYREDGPTILKKRYINQYLNQKLFEVNYLVDTNIGGDLERKVIGRLEREIPHYDLVLVSDFGHGFITGDIIKAIERSSKLLAVNTQTNSANVGFNMITKYTRPNFICLDEPEIRLAAQERFMNIDDVARSVVMFMNVDCLIVTLGKKGSVSVNRKREICRTPIFSNRVVDTVGAGDAFFAFTAPLFATGQPLDLVSFIGNAVGALAVQIVGNKSSVEKHALLEFVHGLLG